MKVLILDSKLDLKNDKDEHGLGVVERDAFKTSQDWSGFCNDFAGQKEPPAACLLHTGDLWSALGKNHNSAASQTASFLKRHAQGCPIIFFSGALGQLAQYQEALVSEGYSGTVLCPSLEELAQLLQAYQNERDPTVFSGLPLDAALQLLSLLWPVGLVWEIYGNWKKALSELQTHSRADEFARDLYAHLDACRHAGHPCEEVSCEGFADLVKTHGRIMGRLPAANDGSLSNSLAQLACAHDESHWLRLLSELRDLLLPT